MGGASLRPRPAFTMMRAVCVAPGSQGGVDASPVWPSGQRSPRRVPRPALPRCPPGVLGALPQLPLSFVPAEQATLNPEAEPLAGVRGPCKEGAGHAQSLSPCMLASFGGGRPRAGGLRRRVGAAKGHCVSQAPSQGELLGDRVCYSASRPPCQQAGSAEDSGRCRLPPRNIKQARAARPALPVPPAATPARGGGWAQWLRLTQDHVRVALGPHAWARVASPCMVSACGI